MNLRSDVKTNQFLVKQSTKNDLSIYQFERHSQGNVCFYSDSQSESWFYELWFYMGL